VEGVAALYAADAVLNIPGAPPARGSAAVREALAKDIEGSSKGGFTLTRGNPYRASRWSLDSPCATL
jgi:ketosteroid isomerase-like protein